VFGALFIFVESRAKEPIIPLDLFKNRIFTLSMITVFITGIGMFGALSYIPLFIQAVQGQSATTSGNSIMPTTFAMILASVASGQLVSRLGKYRVLGIVGMILLDVGLFLLASMTTETPLWQTTLYMIVLGLGLGIAMPLYNLIVQNAFPLERIGVVTSSLTFFRSIGGTVGLAILGALVNNRFQSQFVTELRGINPQMADRLPAEFTQNLTPQALVNPQAMAGIKQALEAQHLSAATINIVLDSILKAMKPALAVATTEAFLIGGGVVVIALIATAFIKELPLRKRNDDAPRMAME
jgi:MFS family permease